MLRLDKSIPSSKQPNFRLLLTITVSVRGCYTRKLAPARVHTGMTFLFRSHLHDDGSFHTSLILKCTSCWKKYSLDSKSQTLRMRYPFQPTVKSEFRFHTETGGRFAFTWYSCEISYRSEILAPVQQLGWYHTGVTRAGMTFCGDIL